MKNKILMGIFMIIILMTNVSFASYDTVTMSVVEEPICTIQLGESSKFEKKLIKKDLTNKEVTLQLQVTNEELAKKPTGEIMLVLDNSHSMSNIVSGSTTRRDLIFNSAKTLVSNLLEDNTQLKIGIVSFSTNLDPTQEGTLNDATVVCDLSNDINTLTNAISNIETNGPRTDLQAGLVLANQKFTQAENSKFMIVLTDGIPNVAINYDKQYFSNDVINKTKQQLLDLNQQGVKISTMLTVIEDESFIPNTTTNKTYAQIINEIFGTQANPTVGNFYYVTDNEIEKTITNDIYNSLLPIEKILKDITIVDYFPAEIVKNFDFAYVTNANVGTISTKIDTTNNSITWNIPELASGQTATVQYKLKLKKDFDSAIVGKILNTNQKVDIDYTDTDEKKQTKTSDISPKLKLIDPKPTTEAPKILPKAGSSLVLVSFGVLTIGLFIISTIKLIQMHKNSK